MTFFRRKQDEFNSNLQIVSIFQSGNTYSRISEFLLANMTYVIKLASKMRPVKSKSIGTLTYSYE